MNQHSLTRKISSAMLFLLLFFSSFVSAKIIYVDDDASGQNDGSSWENAYIYLQDAIYEANYSVKPIEIRVAQGTYTPDKGANAAIEDNYESFEMLTGVTLSGGYAGYLPSQTEIDPDTRDIELYQTILSGDLLNNDSNDYDPNNLVNEETFSDNSYHVVTASFTDETSILDGFTITAGIAGGYDLYIDSRSKGGAIYIESSIDGPVIANCTFTKNAAYDGGAIYSTDSDPNISQCKFIRNSANYIYELAPLFGDGGAIFISQSNSIIKDCNFIENLGGSGGGIFILKDSNFVLINCQFISNTANLTKGGALLINESYPIIKDCYFYDNNSALAGGGIAIYSSANPILDNCIFNTNTAGSLGGAIYNISNSEPNISNCIFTRNFARTKGGAISSADSNSIFKNCIFSGNKSNNGGAFDISSSTLPCNNTLLSSCFFSNNSAKHGGAIINQFENLLLRNCVFSGNVDFFSAGAIFNAGGNLQAINCTYTGNYSYLSCDAILNKTLIFDSDELPDIKLNVPGHIEISNCIIWNGPNSITNDGESSILISYSNLSGGKPSINSPIDNLIWGPGNIDIEPAFVQNGFWIDINDPNIVVEPYEPNAFWLEGDYHLKSGAGHYDPNSQTWILDDINSPCIDSGDPNSLFENEPLPNGGRINMGAYGGTTQASKSTESLIANKEPDNP